MIILTFCSRAEFPNERIFLETETTYGCSDIHYWLTDIIVWLKINGLWNIQFWNIIICIDDCNIGYGEIRLTIDIFGNDSELKIKLAH